MIPSLALALLLTAHPAPHGGDDGADHLAGPIASPPRAQIRGALARGDYHSALELIEDHLVRRPEDPTLLYQAGCVHARLGDPDEAAAYLVRAVDAGFVDYAVMRVDPDLECIREHPIYIAVLEEADRVLEQWRANPLAVWQESFGHESYRYERDELRRLSYATALDERSHAAMKAELAREADYLVSRFFARGPDYEVLVATPTAEDASRLFHGKDRYGGVYEHASRRLIARDIGASLRHEFFHLMHFGHMQRLGILQPIWIQEGWASLYEDCSFTADGEMRLLPSHRNDVVYHLGRANKLLPWPTLLTMPQSQFMKDAGRAYAQSRSVFQYMHEMALLEDWYRDYVRELRTDPTGARSLENVFAAPLARIERDWREWVLDNPPDPPNLDLGDEGLGLRTEMRGSNDGVLLTGVVPGSEPDRAGIRAGDVVVAVNDQSTRSLLELRAIIGRQRKGVWVEMRLRREDDYLVVPVKLSPVASPSERAPSEAR